MSYEGFLFVIVSANLICRSEATRRERWRLIKIFRARKQASERKAWGMGVRVIIAFWFLDSVRLAILFY